MSNALEIEVDDSQIAKWASDFRRAEGLEESPITDRRDAAAQRIVRVRGTRFAVVTRQERAGDDEKLWIVEFPGASDCGWSCSSARRAAEIIALVLEGELSPGRK